MARTQAADYDAKREAITGHAAQLFARKGFAAASVSDLAERCKVSKSLIYHYYASKEEILFDVMIDHIDELLDAAQSINTKDAAPDQALRSLTKELLRHYVGAADRQKVLLYELESLPPAKKTEIVNKQREIIAIAEAILKKAAPTANMGRAALRARTMLYFGMLNWSHTWFDPKGAVTREGLADMAVDLMLGQ